MLLRAVQRQGTAGRGASRPGGQLPGAQLLGVLGPGRTGPGAAHRGARRQGTAGRGASRPGAQHPGREVRGPPHRGARRQGTVGRGASRPGTARPGGQLPGAQLLGVLGPGAAARGALLREVLLREVPPRGMAGPGGPGLGVRAPGMAVPLALCLGMVARLVTIGDVGPTRRVPVAATPGMQLARNAGGARRAPQRPGEGRPAGQAQQGRGGGAIPGPGLRTVGGRPRLRAGGPRGEFRVARATADQPGHLAHGQPGARADPGQGRRETAREQPRCRHRLGEHLAWRFRTASPPTSLTRSPQPNCGRCPVISRRRLPAGW